MNGSASGEPEAIPCIAPRERCHEDREPPLPAAIARLAARILTAPKTSVAATAVSDDLLTLKQAAGLLHVSPKYVYGHVRELGGVRLGNCGKPM